MSLFERIKNKRHNLTEQPGGTGFTDKQQADTNKLLNKLFGDKGKARRTAKKAIGGSPTMNPTPDDVAGEKSIRRKQKKIEKTFKTGDKPKSTLDNMAKNIAQQDIEAEGGKFKQPVSGTSQAKDFKPEPGSQKLGNTTTGGPVKVTKTKTVNQAEVSKKAKDFTKKINRAGSFEDLTGEGKVKYPKTRKELEAKRKEYQIDPKTNQPSKEGIKRYAEKAKQLKSGSNVPVKVTQADLDRAKKNMVGGQPVKNKAGKVIGTTTGKIGGKLNPLATKAELDAIKAAIKSSKTIDAKPLPKVFDPKASKELGTDVFKRIKKRIPSTKTRPGKIIDTPKRRIKILKPLPSTKPLEPLTKTAYNPYKATKATSRFGRALTALKKNPKTALAAAAIGAGVYLYNQGKKNPKGIIPPVGGGGKIKSADTVDINFTLGGKGGYGGSAGRTSKGAN